MSRATTIHALALGVLACGLVACSESALGPGGPAAAPVVTRGARVSQGLVAFYDFSEGGGTTVNDTSGFGTPLNLTIADPQNVTWTSLGLLVVAPTIIDSGAPATKLFNALTATGELTIEAWVVAANTSQKGPASIVTMSDGAKRRNFTLGQDKNRLEARLRTTVTDLDAKDERLRSPKGTFSSIRTHVVFTRLASGDTRLYLNGVEEDARNFGGDFSNWDGAYWFGLGNEFGASRSWLGEYRLVAIYDRALSAQEVQTNFVVGDGSPPPTQTTAGLQVLYEFDEGSGTTVRDVSGVGTPMDLTIVDPTAVTWTRAGLSIDAPTIVDSGGPATKLITACQATNEITIEAWVLTANLSQKGPASIATLSGSTQARNVTLGQDKDKFDGRVRTTATDLNADSDRIREKPVTGASQQVVFTRAANGDTRLFIDGLERKFTSFGGDFSNWDGAYWFGLGDEFGGGRSWLGEYQRLAVYDRALTPQEVNDNFTVGLPPLPPATRTTAGLQALYRFDEGSGTTVTDQSGVGTPMNLTINDPTAVSWTRRGLSINAATLVDSGGPATKLLNACQLTNEITIEAWVVPANNKQKGPARMITCSDGTSDRNYTLGQDGDRMRGYIRSTQTDPDAANERLQSPKKSVAPALTHFVLTRFANGDTALYVNGVQGDFRNYGGDFSSWDPAFWFGLGNEFGATGTWFGEYQLVAIYDQAMTAATVRDNFAAGTGKILPPVRATAGLQALYRFDEGSGATVNDVSGVGTPMDLTIANPGAVSWSADGLTLNAATLIETGGPATKLISACQATNEVTIEAWVVPANATQKGPAAIVTMSGSARERNFTLGQDGDRFDGRVRSTGTNLDVSKKKLRSKGGTLSTALTHVVLTRFASGDTLLYVDGVLSKFKNYGGDLSNWDPNHAFGLGDDFGGANRPWLGQYRLVAIYDRGLTASEVLDNFNSGANCPPFVPGTLIADPALASALLGFIPGPTRALLVTATVPLSSDMHALHCRLQTRGIQTTVVHEDAVGLGDARGQDLIVLGPGVLNPAAAAMFQNVAIPVVALNAAQLGGLGMVSTAAPVSAGTASVRDLAIVDSRLGITASVVRVASVPQSVGWGVPLASADVFATLASNRGRATLFAYDPGTVAPARRVAAVQLDATTFAPLTVDGWELFDLAIAHAVAPVVRASLRRELATPTQIAYDAGASTDALGNPNGLTVGWAFGEGSSSASEAGTISIAAGAHLATVTVSDAIGRTAIRQFAYTAGAVSGAAFVVGDQYLSTGEQAMAERLAGLLSNVRVIGSADLQPADVVGMTLALLSASVPAAVASDLFPEAEKPLIVWGGQTAADAGVATSAGPLTHGANTLTILDSTHPTAAGLFGTVTVYAGDGRLAGSPVRAGMTEVAAGGAIVAYGNSGYVPKSARPVASLRVAWFLAENTAYLLSPDGWALVDAAVGWAENNTGDFFGAGVGTVIVIDDTTSMTGAPGLTAYAEARNVLGLLPPSSTFEIMTFSDIPYRYNRRLVDSSPFNIFFASTWLDLPAPLGDLAPGPALITAMSEYGAPLDQVVFIADDTAESYAALTSVDAWIAHHQRYNPAFTLRVIQVGPDDTGFMANLGVRPGATLLKLP